MVSRVMGLDGQAYKVRVRRGSPPLLDSWVEHAMCKEAFAKLGKAGAGRVHWGQGQGPWAEIRWLARCGERSAARTLLWSER